MGVSGLGNLNARAASEATSTQQASQHFVAPWSNAHYRHIPPQVCAAKSSNKTGGSSTCTGSWENVGSVKVSCAAGKLVLSLQGERGYSLGDMVDVVATCDNSAFTSLSSCQIANSGNTTVTAVAGGIQVASSDWNDQCVCASSRRRPVMKLTVNDVIAGAACQG